MSAGTETPWWWPELADAAFCERVRQGYPETATWYDEEIIELYADGWKYADTHDHLGDARAQLQELSDAFLQYVERYGWPIEPEDS